MESLCPLPPTGWKLRIRHLPKQAIMKRKKLPRKHDEFPHCRSRGRGAMLLPLATRTLWLTMVTLLEACRLTSSHLSSHQQSLLQTLLLQMWLSQRLNRLNWVPTRDLGCHVSAQLQTCCVFCFVASMVGIQALFNRMAAAQNTSADGYEFGHANDACVGAQINGMIPTSIQPGVTIAVLYGVKSRGSAESKVVLKTGSEAVVV